MYSDPNYNPPSSQTQPNPSIFAPFVTNPSSMTTGQGPDLPRVTGPTIPGNVGSTVGAAVGTAMGGNPSVPNAGSFSWGAYGDPKAGFLAALNAGQSGEALVQAANQNYNLGYGGGFAYYPDKNVYATPGGGYYAIGPDGKWGWNQGDSGGGQAGGQGGFSAGMGSVTRNNPAMSAFEKQLLGELGPESANPAFSTDPNSPILRAQTDAFRASQQQGVRDLLSSKAEQSGTNANLDAVTRSAYEKAGQNTSQFTSQLMQEQLKSRQGEIQQVLSLYGNMLDQDTAMQLQEELAQLNLAQGAYQFDATRQDTLAGF